MSFKRNATVTGLLAISLVLTGTGLTKLSAQAESPVQAKKPAIDLVFCIDTTGSMEAEIGAVKAKTKEIVAKLAGSKPTPDIRVGVVAFKDKGDEYLTKVYPFTDNIDQIVKDIQELKAVGGGDEPEAVTEALHAAVNELHWHNDKKAVKVVFLIGDAGPKKYDLDWADESRKAIAKGIQVNTVACDGLGGDGLSIFQQIAKLTDGSAETLTYRQEVVNAEGKKETIISSGGRRYAVAGDSDAWREGAGTLASRGVAREVAAPRSASYAAGGRGASVAGALLPPVSMGKSISRAYDSRMPVAPSAMGMSFSESASGDGATTRGDSNLADIVLRSTQKALKKKMGD